MTLPNKKIVAALGSFDGLHKGHMSVIFRALELQRERGFSPVAMTFDVHPELILKGKAPAKLLQNETRDKILSGLGVEVRTVKFSEIRNMSCSEFFNEILIKRLNAGAVCCGGNYRFGKGGEGGVRTLGEICGEYGAELRVAERIDLDGAPVSSTRIREAIENGNLRFANEALGGEFRYGLTVVGGERRGRLIGAPTINQRFENGFVRPKSGVYASAAEVDGKLYPSVTDIGLRPSFENGDFHSETCILGYDGNLYGGKVEVRLFEYLREEIKFESIDALSNQIRADSEKAKIIFLRKGMNPDVR